MNSYRLFHSADVVMLLLVVLFQLHAAKPAAFFLVFQCTPTVLCRT